MALVSKKKGIDIFGEGSGEGLIAHLWCFYL